MRKGTDWFQGPVRGYRQRCLRSCKRRRFLKAIRERLSATKFSCDREADKDYSCLREYRWFGGTVEGTGNGNILLEKEDKRWEKTEKHRNSDHTFIK